MYTLDTNVVIYYLAKKDEVVYARINAAILNGQALYVSAVSVAELFRYPRLTEGEAENIRQFLSVCSIISIDGSIAMRAGEIGRKCGVKLADSIIAATALFTGSSLVTRNVRDFKRVPDLTIEPI